MVYRNFTQRGLVPQSSGAPVSPDRHTRAASAGPHAGPAPGLPPGREPGPFCSGSLRPHSPNLSVAGALAGPIPIARMPAAARPDVTCLSLKRPAEAIPTRIIRLLHGLPPGPGQAMYSAAAKTRGRPRPEEAPRPVGSCARAGEPGVPGMVPRRPTPPVPGPLLRPPAGKQAELAARLVKTPTCDGHGAGGGTPSGGVHLPRTRPSQAPRDAGRRRKGEGRALPGRTSPRTGLPSSMSPAMTPVIPQTETGPVHE